MQDRNSDAVRAWKKTHAGTLPRSLQDFLYESPSPKIPPLADKLKDSILMELSLLVGIVHILSSLIRYLRRHLSYLGWILAVIGGYLYFPHYLEANSLLHYCFNLSPEPTARIGLELIGAGILFAVAGAIFQRGISGIGEISVAVQIFGDVLSYLRIYALALAGSMVGSIANNMATPLPFVIGALLILFSHVVNILLSIISGVIHGLRLNFLEWYHYSFEGGGKRFYPFKLETSQ